MFKVHLSKRKLKGSHWLSPKGFGSLALGSSASGDCTTGVGVAGEREEAMRGQVGMGLKQAPARRRHRQSYQANLQG